MKYILFGFSIFANNHRNMLPKEEDIVAYSYSDVNKCTKNNNLKINNKPILSVEDYPMDYDKVIICSSPLSMYSCYEYLVKNHIKSKKIFYFNKKISRFKYAVYCINNFFIKRQQKKNDYEQEKINQIVDRVTLNVQRALDVAFLHKQTFGPYRNKHFNETVVLIAAGPSLQYFTPLTEKCIYVGVNRAFLFDKVKYDYLFTIDKRGLDTGLDNYFDKFFKYDCIKFVGDQNAGKRLQIPQNYLGKYSNIFRYKTTVGNFLDIYNLDIDCYALKNAKSVSIQAMQFILFTNPKKIYLVGFDCNSVSGKHFSGTSNVNELKKYEDFLYLDTENILAMKELKNFVNTYYPYTEIFTINPVGLKGIYHDLYTNKYLNDHPDIIHNQQEYIEILE